MHSSLLRFLLIAAERPLIYYVRMAESLEELEDQFESLFGVRLSASLYLDRPPRGTPEYRTIVQEAVDKKDYTIWSKWTPSPDAMTIA